HPRYIFVCQATGIIALRVSRSLAFVYAPPFGRCHLPKLRWRKPPRAYGDIVKVAPVYFLRAAFFAAGFGAGAFPWAAPLNGNAALIRAIAISCTVWASPCISSE